MTKCSVIFAKSLDIQKINVGSKKKAIVVEKLTYQNNLFMTHFLGDYNNSKFWLLDSGCSSHMIGKEISFQSD